MENGELERQVVVKLPDIDRLVIIDVLRMRLASAEEANSKVKEAGWTGTGLIGYEIGRLMEILAKLEAYDGS